MNFTPASSSDLPSAAIFTRVSESGTRLMQTAIFMSKWSAFRRQSSGKLQDVKPQAVHSLKRAGKQTRQLSSGNRLRLTACDCSERWRLEVCTQADLHVPRWARREPALDWRARCRGILGEGAEREDAPVEQVPHRAAQLEGAPGQRERQIGDGIVGQAARDVRLVAP